MVDLVDIDDSDLSRVDFDLDLDLVDINDSDLSRFDFDLDFDLVDPVDLEVDIVEGDLLRRSMCFVCSLYTSKVD